MKRRRTPARSQLLDLAADELLADNRAFTPRNLFHAVRRTAERLGDVYDLDFGAFRMGPLAARLARGQLPGLLPDVEPPNHGPPLRLPREWDAYFPACILIVDRAELVPLFAASGVVLQARMAVIALDGRPAHVVSWLCRGLRARLRAPIGYLHDAATVVYPFDREPLATWSRLRKAREDAEFRDLGFPPQGVASARFGLQGGPLFELEALSPQALIAYAARALLAMIPPDRMLFPLTSRRPRPRSGRLEVAHD
jgi:hypothetical protein